MRRSSAAKRMEPEPTTQSMQNITLEYFEKFSEGDRARLRAALEGAGLQVASAKCRDAFWFEFSPRCWVWAATQRLPQ